MEKKLIISAITIVGITIFGISFSFYNELTIIQKKEYVIYENSTHNDNSRIYENSTHNEIDNSITNEYNPQIINEGDKNYLMIPELEIPKSNNEFIFANQTLIDKEKLPEILRLGEQYRNDILGFNYTASKNIRLMMDPQPVCTVFEGQQPWLIYHKSSSLFAGMPNPFAHVIPSQTLEKKGIQAFIISNNETISELKDKCEYQGQIQFNLPKFEEPIILVLVHNGTYLIGWDLDYQ